jgi:tetratricopeptide (TPR) repeat protein
MRNEKVCAACSHEGTTHRCPCKGDRYCDAVCQKKHWSAHRITCTIDHVQKLQQLFKDHGKISLEVAQAQLILGQLWHKRGAYESAEASLLEVIRIEMILLGSVKCDTGCSQSLLCQWYHEQLRGSEALKMGEDALYNLNATQGENSLDAAFTLINLGLACLQELKYREGVQRFMQALVIYRIHNGTNDHPSVAMTLHNLSKGYDNLGQEKRARNLRLKALAMERRNLDSGVADPNVSCTWLCLAQEFKIEGRLDEALVHYRKALPLMRLSHGEKHPQVCIILYEIGVVYKKQGKLEEALKVLRKCLKYSIRSLGDKHVTVGLTREVIADIHIQREEYTEALLHLTKQYDVLVDRYGPNHVNTQRYYHRIMSVILGEYSIY